MSNYRNDVGGLPPGANETYYNILIKNNNVATGISAPAIPITFQETRSNPYINPANDYYMSVIAFEVDTQAVPVFICDAVPGSTDKQATPYAVTIQSGSSTLPSPTTVIWVPEDSTAVSPPVPVPDNYDNYEYYYSYTFNHFLNLVNTAIATAYSTAGGSVKAPFLQLVNGQVSLVANKAEFESASTSPVIPTPTFTLYFNTILFNLFSSLNAKKIYIVNKPAANYQIFFYAYPDNSNVKPVYQNLSTVPPSNPYNAIFNDCEYSPFPFWNPVDSIVFQTQQLTIVPELIAKPVAYGPNNLENVGTNADSYYVLTDFASPLLTGTEYKPNISYLPKAEFRLAELYGEGALNSIYINVSWKDKFGLLHPLLLEVGGTAYIKIMFRKKTYYTTK